MPNKSFQRTVKKLRFLPSAEFTRWAVNMNAMSVVFAAVVAVLPFTSLAQQQGDGPPQRGYSVEPLRSPIFDPAKVVVETTALNNWLGANIQKLNHEQMKGPHEHL